MRRHEPTRHDPTRHDPTRHGRAIASVASVASSAPRRPVVRAPASCARTIAMTATNDCIDRSDFYLESRSARHCAIIVTFRAENCKIHHGFTLRPLLGVLVFTWSRSDPGQLSAGSRSAGSRSWRGLDRRGLDRRGRTMHSQLARAGACRRPHRGLAGSPSVCPERPPWRSTNGGPGREDRRPIGGVSRLSDGEACVSGVAGGRVGELRCLRPCDDRR